MLLCRSRTHDDLSITNSDDLPLSHKRIVFLFFNPFLSLFYSFVTLDPNNAFPPIYICGKLLSLSSMKFSCRTSPMRCLPFLRPFKFPFATKTESSSFLESNLDVALFAMIVLDALSIACHALSMVPDGLRWSSPALLHRKRFRTQS